MTARRKKPETFDVRSDRRIHLIGPVDDGMHYHLSEELARMETEGPEDVLVVIDSDGGELHRGFGIHDAIYSSAVPVHVLARGGVMSAAMIILQAGKKRLATPHTTFMLHQLRYNLDEVLHTHAYHAKVGQDAQDMMESILLARANLTKDQLQSRTQHDYYLLVDEALKLGLIDAVIA